MPRNLTPRRRNTYNRCKGAPPRKPRSTSLRTPIGRFKNVNGVWTRHDGFTL